MILRHDVYIFNTVMVRKLFLGHWLFPARNHIYREGLCCTHVLHTYGVQIEYLRVLVQYFVYTLPVWYMDKYLIHTYM